MQGSRTCILFGQTPLDYTSSDDADGVAWEHESDNSAKHVSDNESNGPARTTTVTTMPVHAETSEPGLKQKVSRPRVASGASRHIPTLQVEVSGCAGRTRRCCTRARRRCGRWLINEARVGERPVVWRVFADIQESNLAPSSGQFEESVRMSATDEQLQPGHATHATPDSLVGSNPDGGAGHSVMLASRQHVLEQKVLGFEDELAARPTWRKAMCPAPWVRFWTYEYRAPRWLVRSVNSVNVGRRNLAALMEGNLARFFILLCILLNTASLGADHYMISASSANVLQTANLVFTIVFIIEAILKITGDGFMRYISDGFNRFDFVIVCMSILELTILSGTSGLSAFRAIRVFRVVRIVRYLRSMQQIFSVVVKSLPSFSYIGLLLLLFAFIYAVLGMQLFGGTFDPSKIGGEPDDSLPRNNFDTLHVAFITVFQVLTAEAWNEVAYDWAAMTTPWHMVYFVSWVILGKYILLNLFLAILLDNFGAVGDEEDESELENDYEELARLDSRGEALGQIQQQALIKARMRQLLTETKTQADVKAADQKRGRLATLARNGVESTVVTRASSDTLLHQRRPSARRGSSAESSTEDDNPCLPPQPTALRSRSPMVEDIMAGNVVRLWKRQPVGQSTPGSLHVPTPLEERIPGVTTLRSAPRVDTPTRQGWGAMKSAQLADRLTAEVETESAHCVRRASMEGVPLSSNLHCLPIVDSTTPGNTAETTSVRSVGLNTGGAVHSAIADRPTGLANDGTQDAARPTMPTAASKAPIAVNTDLSAPEGDPYSWPFKAVPGWCGRHLFLFAPNGAIARFWRKIVSPSYSLINVPSCGSKLRSITFDNIILVFIIIGSVLLAMEGPPDKDSSTGNHRFSSPLGIVDLVLTVIFACEIGVKMVAYGFALHQHAFLRNGYNVVDFIVVCASVLDLILSDIDSDFVRIFRLLRCLRPIRMVSRNKGLRVVISALLRSVGGLANVAGVLFLVWLMFAILGVQLFAGRLHQCNDPDFPPNTPRDGVLSATSTASNVVYAVLPCNASVMFLDESGEEVPREWTVGRPNFDNIFEAMLTLFITCTGEGWPDVMFQVSDTTGVDRSPEEGAAPWNAFYFVVFVCLGEFFFLDLFVGVIFDNFMRLKRKLDWSGFLTDEQRVWVNEQRRIASIRPPKVALAPKQAWRRKLFTSVSSPGFEAGIMICILLNVVLLAMAFYGQPAAYTLVLDVANWLFTIIFAVEAVLRILAYGPGAYFKDPWYRFDFFVVVASVADLVIAFLDASLFRVFRTGRVLSRVFRTLRVGRIARLAKQIDGVRTVLLTLWYSLPSMLNVGALLLLLLSIFALVGVQVFGNVEYGEDLDRHANFGTFPVAMLALFRFTTGEGWEGVMFDTMDERNGGTPWAPLYFLVFMTLAMFIMIKIFVMILLEEFAVVEQQNEQSIGFLLSEFNKVWSYFDPAGKKKIPANEVEALLRSLPPPYGISPAAPFRVFLERLRVLQLKAWGPYLHYREVLAALHRVATGYAIPESVLAATGTAPVVIQRKIQHRVQKRVERKQWRERLKQRFPGCITRWVTREPTERGSERTTPRSPTRLRDIAKHVRAAKAAAKAAAAAEVELDPSLLSPTRQDRTAPVRHTNDDLRGTMVVLRGIRDMRVEKGVGSPCESNGGYGEWRLHHAMVDESIPVDYAELVAGMTLRQNMTNWIKRTRMRMQNQHRRVSRVPQGMRDQWRTYKPTTKLLPSPRSTRRSLFQVTSAGTSANADQWGVQSSQSKNAEAAQQSSSARRPRPPRGLAKVPQESQSARTLDISRRPPGSPAARRGAASISPEQSPLRVETTRWGRSPALDVPREFSSDASPKDQASHDRPASAEQWTPRSQGGTKPIATDENGREPDGRPASEGGERLATASKAQYHLNPTLVRSPLVHDETSPPTTMGETPEAITAPVDDIEMQSASATNPSRRTSHVPMENSESSDGHWQQK